MGDKTQIATAILAARFDAIVAVIAGTTLGMLVADVPVVFAGKLAADRIPFAALRKVAAGLFIVAGHLGALEGHLAGSGCGGRRPVCALPKPRAPKAGRYNRTLADDEQRACCAHSPFMTKSFDPTAIERAAQAAWKAGDVYRARENDARTRGASSTACRCCRTRRASCTWGTCATTRSTT